MNMNVHRILLILGLSLGWISLIYTQVIPKGMSYQAVARSSEGKPLANQQIDLKIYLFSQENNLRKEYYIESHQVHTDPAGLFNIIIGEGQSLSGQFGLIPWNDENIWLEVAVKDRLKNVFNQVTQSKLLAVPYAFHASTTNTISGSEPKQELHLSGPGVISNEWSVFGNAMTDASGNLYHTNALGTTDKVDLIMITDNVERLRILKGGDIITKLNFKILQNLKVGGDLNITQSSFIDDSIIAKKNVLFNILGGATFNHGPFSVFKQSPGLLSGTLQVNLNTYLNSTLTVDGPTDLNDSLCVNNMSPTYFTGRLQVDSTTNLQDNLSVLNSGPVVLTGTLAVDSCTTLNDKLKILSAYSTDTSGAIVSGSLQIAGGAYIKENLYVGGIAKFVGPVGFGSAVSITDGTQSTNTMTGALIVAGGVGIGLNLNIGGAARIGQMVTIKDRTEATSPFAGALKVLGGVGIQKRLNVRGSSRFLNSLSVFGATSMFDALQVNSNPNQRYVAFFRNTSNQNGISIQIENSEPGWSNNFIEFRNSASAVIGRVEGETTAQHIENAGYHLEIARINGSVLAATTAQVVADIKFLVAAKQLIGAAASATPCIGLGVMGCAPIVSFIVKASADLVAQGVALVGFALSIDETLDRRDEFIAHRAARTGVTYESGAGDYAEWLPKADPDEKMLPGYIVSIKNGLVSKKISKNEKPFVISSKPIILGNQPIHENIRTFEKVAFLGQVPVYVIGKVNIGDYIIPSGRNDGLGVAIAPGKIKIEEYTQIVGLAWSASEDKAPWSLIQVAIGLHGDVLKKMAMEQKHKIEQLQLKIKRRNSILAKLVPGFKEAAGIQDDEMIFEDKPLSNENVFQGMDIADSSVINLLSSMVTKNHISEVVDQALLKFKQDAHSSESNVFWNKISTDPIYKENLTEQVHQMIQDEFTKLLKTQTNSAND